MAAPQPMPLEEIEKHFTPPRATGEREASGQRAPLPLDELPDLTPVELALTIAGREYKLKEVTEAGFIAWRTALLKASKPGPDGKPTSLEGVHETTSLLVSLCLFRDGKPVPLEEVRRLPTRVVQALFDKVQDISGLREPDPTPPPVAVPPSPPEEAADSEAPPAVRHSTRTMWPD